MDQNDVKLPNINNRGNSSGQAKRSGSFASLQNNAARSAFVAKKERKE